MKMKACTRLSPSPSECENNLESIGSFLHGTELFKDLGPSELDSLFTKVDVRTYPAGSIIFMPGDPSCERLYILRQGRVHLYRLTVNGRRLVTRQILPGSSFGIRGVFGRTLQTNFAEAVEKSTICIISREQFLTLLKSRPDLMLCLLEAVCRRFHLLEERFVQEAYDSVKVKLACFLLDNADPASGVLTNVTHEEMGNIIGAVRQTVTETLGMMQEQELIMIKPKCVQIIDRHRLEELTQGSDNQS